MHRLGINMAVKCDRQKVLAVLRENRTKHAELVAEARAGYLNRATVALTERLEKLRTGKIVSCAFQLHMPLDYTHVYDTAIHMLELHVGETIELQAEEFRHLVDDQWDWLESFTSVNSSYSAGTAALARLVE